MSVKEADVNSRWVLASSFLFAVLLVAGAASAQEGVVLRGQVPFAFVVGAALNWALRSFGVHL